MAIQYHVTHSNICSYWQEKNEFNGFLQASTKVDKIIRHG